MYNFIAITTAVLINDITTTNSTNTTTTITSNIYNVPYSSNQISQVILPTAAHLQNWNAAETDLILFINEYRKNKIMNGNKINFNRLNYQYHYQAQIKILESPSTQLFRRTIDMLKHRVKHLRESNMWK